MVTVEAVVRGQFVFLSSGEDFFAARRSLYNSVKKVFSGIKLKEVSVTKVSFEYGRGTRENENEEFQFL